MCFSRRQEFLMCRSTRITRPPEGDDSKIGTQRPQSLLLQRLSRSFLSYSKEIPVDAHPERTRESLSKGIRGPERTRYSFSRTADAGRRHLQRAKRFSNDGSATLIRLSSKEPPPRSALGGCPPTECSVKSLWAAERAPIARPARRPRIFESSMPMIGGAEAQSRQSTADFAPNGRHCVWILERGLCQKQTRSSWGGDLRVKGLVIGRAFDGLNMLVSSPHDPQTGRSRSRRKPLQPKKPSARRITPRLPLPAGGFQKRPPSKKTAGPISWGTGVVP